MTAAEPLWGRSGGPRSGLPLSKSTLVALLPPLVAFGLQSVFWPTLQPYVWFLFYPAVFFSSWVGGLPGGLGATVLSIMLVNSYFIPPESSLATGHPRTILSVGVFMTMGILFGFLHGRLRKRTQQATEAMAAVQSANEMLESRVSARTGELQREIIERERAEGEILALNTDLERRVEERTAELNRFFTLSLDMLCIASADGYFKRISPAFTQTLGFSVEEILSRPFLDFVHPDDHSATLLEVEKQVAAGETVLNFQNRYRHKDGSWRWLSWKSMPQPGGLMYASARDVTERRQAEETIAQLNAELHAHATRLEGANKELESFAYSVSHDLRAPLRGMDGFSQALLEDYAGQVDATGQDYLRRIRGGAQRMGQLIDDLLELSRVTRSEMVWDPVDLTALAHKVIAELQPQQAGRAVEWDVSDPLTARGDLRLLQLVLENLLANALKFTGKSEHPRIEFGQVAHEAEPVFFVRDNGAGFDMAYANRLFGAFQRLHSPLEFPGTGIGLATVQRIIHRHGGRVWAEAKPGKGATFSFTLEAAK